MEMKRQHSHNRGSTAITEVAQPQSKQHSHNRGSTATTEIAQPQPRQHSHNRGSTSATEAQAHIFLVGRSKPPWPLTVAEGCRIRSYHNASLQSVGRCQKLKGHLFYLFVTICFIKIFFANHIDQEGKTRNSLSHRLLSMQMNMRLSVIDKVCAKVPHSCNLGLINTFICTYLSISQTLRP